MDATQADPSGGGTPGESHLREVFDSIDEGFCIAEMVLDAGGTPVDYRFLEINPRFEEMTGLAGARGRTAFELVPDLEPVWVQTYARVALDGEALRFEQGSAVMGRWFDVFAVPLSPRGRFALVFRDETARHDAVRRLSEQHRLVTELTEVLPGVLEVWDAATGEPVRVSGRTADATGLQPEEIRALGGRFGTEVVHPDDRASFAAHRARLRDLADGDTAVVEYRVRHTDGTWRWLSGRDVVLERAEDGTVRRVLGIALDVTERRELEETLRATARAQAYRALLADTVRGSSDPVEIQARAATVLGEHLGAARVHYAEVVEGGTVGVVHADYSNGLASVVGRHRLDDYGAELMALFRSGVPVVVDDVRADPRVQDAEGRAVLELGIGAFVMWPLVKDEASVAALVVHSTSPRAWSTADLASIDETAERTWSSVHRARAEAALARRSARAELVAGLLVGLEGEPSVRAQSQRLAELLVPSFADFATVEVPGGAEVLLGAAHRDPALLPVLRELRTRHRLAAGDPRSVARAAAGRPQLIAEVTPELWEQAASSPQTLALLRRLGQRSHMAVPLHLGRDVDGVVMVGLSDPDRAGYDEQSLAFLQEVAERAGVVLAAARVRQEEHDIAVRLQRALLPDRLVWHPEVVVDARYEAAHDLLEVGGDWYDSFSWPGGEVGALVGDVVGHNLASAATMGRLRAATAALATTLPPSPAALLEALEQFARGPDGTDYATAACVVLEPVTGVLRYSTAGHPPPVVLAPGRRPVRLDGANAPAICAAAPGHRPEQEVRLEPGSTVVLYSDGLVERRREPIDVGIARLEEAAARLVALGLDGDEVARRLVAELADGAVADDVVVACLQWSPSLATFETAIDADGRRLAGLRRALRRWMTDQEVPQRTAEDVLLSLGEACSNAVEHAYDGSTSGVVEVRVTHHGRHLVGRVRDRGTWRPTSRQDPFRGRGTGIMRDLSARFDRRTGADGTEVLMLIPLPSEHDRLREEVS